MTGGTAREKPWLFMQLVPLHYTRLGFNLMTTKFWNCWSEYTPDDDDDTEPDGLHTCMMVDVMVSLKVRDVKSAYRGTMW